MSVRIGIIVGLGNPGAEYADTRHNAGFWFVEQLARKYGVSFKSEKKFFGEVARVSEQGQDIWLLKPTTFMNLSGQAVQTLAAFYKIGLPEILVVHDDLDLPTGIARLKQGGGHGGHNGLRDIIARMGGNDFARLRLGIGHPGDKAAVTGHVLNRVTREDRTAIEGAISASMQVLPDVLAGNFSKAMNQLHSQS